jgi:hypothetical protein
MKREMQRKKPSPSVSFFLLLLAVLLAPLLSQAQQEIDTAVEEPVVQAVINAPSAALINTPVSFDAADSMLPEGVEVRYQWIFGDGQRAEGERTTHTYTRPGTYTVTLVLTTPEERTFATATIRVFSRAHILLADDTAPPGLLSSLTALAAKEETYLLPLKKQSGEDARAFANRLLDRHGEVLKKTSLLTTWMGGTGGTDLLTALAQQLSPSDRGRIFVKKGIIVITEQPFAVVARPAQQVFNLLMSRYVLLTRPQAVAIIVAAPSPAEAKERVIAQGIPARILGIHSQRALTLHLTNFITFGLNELINRGVPVDSIVLTLMLPLVATLFALTRQLIGIRAFGIVTPTIVTLSFLALGLFYGLVVFVTVLVVGTATRFFLRRFQLLYLPRVAIVLTFTSLAIIALLGIGVTLRRSALFSFSIFPVLILVTLVENFVSVQIRRGFRQAVRLTTETLVLAIAATLLVSADVVRAAVLSYPELVLLSTIVLNILIGKWSGLQLLEWYRFRHLLFTPRRRAASTK